LRSNGSKNARHSNHPKELRPKGELRRAGADCHEPVLHCIEVSQQSAASGQNPRLPHRTIGNPLHPSEQTLRAQNAGCTATLILWRTLLEMGTKLIFVCQEPKQARAGCIQRTLDAIPTSPFVGSVVQIGYAQRLQLCL
jgi:hypothetical protein